MKSAEEIKGLLKQKMDYEADMRNHYANSARKHEETGDDELANSFWKDSIEHLDKFFLYKDLYEEITGEKVTLIAE